MMFDKTAWKRVHLGEVVRRSRRQVDPEGTGVERYVGGGHIDSDSVVIQRFGLVGDGQMGSTFRYAFEPGQVLFVSARPYLRKVGTTDFSGVVADKTYVLDAVEENGLVHALLPFLLTSDRFIEYASNEATGSMNPRLLWGPFQRYELALPGEDEQRGIAALMWSIERHRGALKKQLRALHQVRADLGSVLLDSMPDRVVLGDVSRTRSGPSFAATSVSMSPEPGAIPVLGIPNTKQDGSIDLSEVGHVQGLPASVETIDDSSLVLIRTNGNRQRIGNVYLPPKEAHGYAVSAFQFLLKVADPADREYLYWVLRDPSMQARMSDAASGTTGLGNLAVKWLNAQEIPWSSEPADRRAVGERLRPVGLVIEAVEAEAARLDRLRSAVSHAVFGGQSVLVS